MNSTKKSLFLDTLADGSILFLDGAMGTLLQGAGMPPGVAPERFCLDNPAILLDIHKSYIQAGSDIITTCTFGGNRFKLPGGMDPFETCRDLARIARDVADAATGSQGRKIFVAGDVGPCGQFLKPLGPLEPAQLIEAFSVQISGLAAGGVDIVFMETFFDIAELRAAIVAAKRVCDLPVMVSMTFEGAVSLTGSTPEVFSETVQNLQVDILGANCSLGPEEMLPVVEELLASSSTPLVVQPNAGLPELRDGRTIFPLDAERFAEKTAKFGRMGVQILGGCCGTTPEHIRKLRALAQNYKVPPRPESSGIALTSRSSLLRLSAGSALAVIGERINPTGKPLLAQELRKGVFTEALKLADAQVKAGAAALDVNVGAPMVDEAEMLPELVCLLSSRFQQPLSLDSSNRGAIANALPYYPASCLVNSIDGEQGKMEETGFLCKMYGAPFVLLPVAGAELPIKATARIAIVEELLEKASLLGIPRRLILIDALAMAVSSSPEAARECLKVIRWCGREGLATTLGLSNISFGLPARALLNSTFLCMARGAGLSSCIANPSAPGLKEALDAMAALEGHDRDAENFISGYGTWRFTARGTCPDPKKDADVKNLYDAVVSGDREGVVARVEQELASGANPFALVNEVLIPAINEVGSRYERKEYFLPQLIRSAETMRMAFAKLKPLLESAQAPGKKPVVVLATVEGDIHDIGKNIVSLMLGNHGFEIIDLGKDVPAATIVDEAERHKAQIIGLSALMTTTMPRMKDTVDLVRERGLPIRIMIGGAAVTPAFADAIGADAYCDDAVESVRVAQKFTGDPDSCGTK